MDIQGAEQMVLDLRGFGFMVCAKEHGFAFPAFLHQLCGGEREREREYASTVLY